MMIQDIEPYSFHVEYRHERAAEDDILLCYRHNQVLLAMAETGEFVLPTVGEACRAGVLSDASSCSYLFAVDDMKFFCDVKETAEEFSGYRYEPLRDIRNAAPRWRAFAAATGYQLWLWYDKHRFCGRCGSPMQHSITERALQCPDCRNLIYPVIAPSVIVAVTNGDKLLLTRYQMSHSAYRNYALVAGYVETGETVEDTVRREVMEEVGLKVKNIRYYKSQPWSFSGALLLGFFCEVDGDDAIVLDESELEEAVWMPRESLPDRSADVSLTSEMMECVRLGRFVGKSV
jgi:NAD+ diphosphatase